VGAALIKKAEKKNQNKGKGADCSAACREMERRRLKGTDGKWPATKGKEE